MSLVIRRRRAPTGVGMYPATNQADCGPESQGVVWDGAGSKCVHCYGCYNVYRYDLIDGTKLLLGFQMVAWQASSYVAFLQAWHETSGGGRYHYDLEENHDPLNCNDCKGASTGRMAASAGFGAPPEKASPVAEVNVPMLLESLGLKPMPASRDPSADTRSTDWMIVGAAGVAVLALGVTIGKLTA